MSQNSSTTAGTPTPRSGMTHAATAAMALAIAGACGYGVISTSKPAAEPSLAQVSSPVEPISTSAPTSMSQPTAETVMAKNLPRTPTVAAANTAVATTVSTPVKPTMAEPVLMTDVKASSPVARWNLPKGKAVSNREAVQCNLKKGWPVLAVRSMDEENVWYIQAVATPISSELFECIVVIGNLTTPPHSQFQIALIIANDQADAARFPTESVLRDLPADREIAWIVDVVRE